VAHEPEGDERFLPVSPSRCRRAPRASRARPARQPAPGPYSVTAEGASPAGRERSSRPSASSVPTWRAIAIEAVRDRDDDDPRTFESAFPSSSTEERGRDHVQAHATVLIRQRGGKKPSWRAGLPTIRAVRSSRCDPTRRRVARYRRRKRQKSCAVPRISTAFVGEREVHGFN